MKKSPALILLFVFISLVVSRAQTYEDLKIPQGGIGIQCHFDENPTGIPRLLEVLDRFSASGLPIQISEFDVSLLQSGIYLCAVESGSLGSPKRTLKIIKE